MRYSLTKKTEHGLFGLEGDATVGRKLLIRTPGNAAWDSRLQDRKG